MKTSNLLMLAIAAAGFFVWSRTAAGAQRTGSNGPSTPPNDFPGIVPHPNAGTLGTMPYKIPVNFGVIDPNAGWD